MRLPVNKLLLNSGQIEGVPKNPRFIKDAKFEKLKQSIQDDPEMLSLRELLVYPYNDKYVVLGGNMRLRACKELGYKDMECKVIPEDLPAKKLRAIVQKDNIGYGENDTSLLANEWDIEELEYWGVDIPDLSIEEPVSKIAITEEILKLAYEPKEKETIEYDEAIEIDERYSNLRDLVNKLPNNDVKKLCEKRLNDFIGYKFDIIADYYSTTNNEKEREALRKLGLVFSTTEEAIRNGFALADDLLEEFNGEA